MAREAQAEIFIKILSELLDAERKRRMTWVRRQERSYPKQFKTTFRDQFADSRHAAE